MMTKELTEIVFILDKSGSMQSIKQDAIGGFNSFIESQKEVDGDVNVTLILFDNDVKVMYESVDINQVENLNGQTYVPSGLTAMLDAIGLGIDGLNKRISERTDQPKNVVFAIMTDGMENASREYSGSAVKTKIENMQKERDYQFIFLGANIDAIGTAQSIGIKGMYAGNFVADGEGTRSAMLNASEMVTSYRSTGVMNSYIDVESMTNDLPSDLPSLNDIRTGTSNPSKSIGDAFKSVLDRIGDNDNNSNNDGSSNYSSSDSGSNE